MAWGCILPLLLALALLCPGAREEMGTGSEGPQGWGGHAGCWVLGAGWCRRAAASSQPCDCRGGSVFSAV